MQINQCRGNTLLDSWLSKQESEDSLSQRDLPLLGLVAHGFARLSLGEAFTVVDQLLLNQEGLSWGFVCGDEVNDGLSRFVGIRESNHL